MSKELEELKGITRNKIEYIKKQPKIDYVYLKYYEGVLDLISRLESIDNANPSEAMECVNVFGRTSGKSIISLEHHLKTHIDKPFLFICREEYGNKYVVPEKQYLEMQKKLSDYDMINRILKDGIWIECKYPQFKEPCMMKEKVGIYIRGNNIILECYNKNILLSDYKKTFWFKKDKSE